MDSTDPILFGESDAKVLASSEQVSRADAAAAASVPPRLRRADRAQVLPRPCPLDELLDAQPPPRLRRAAAKAHVSAMKRQADDPKVSARRKKAAERAARQRIERIEKAMSELKKVEAAKVARAAKAAQKDKPSEHNPAKASTTDPEARQMRMPDGGTRPAYNVQLAVAVATGGDGDGGDDEGRAIVGVDVTNAGSDVHESQPMRQ